MQKLIVDRPIEKNAKSMAVNSNPRVAFPRRSKINGNTWLISNPFLISLKSKSSQLKSPEN